MRILLFALSVGVIFVMGITELVFVLTDRGVLLTWLFIGVAVSAILLAIFSGYVTRPWVISVQLIFDMCWIGGIIYISGGVLGPAAPLLFAVVIIGTLLLPGVLPFLLASVGSIILGGNALLYVAEYVPFDDAEVSFAHGVGSNELLMTTITVQVLALFLVEILGQTLARRTSEQQLVVGDLLDQIGDGIVLIDERGAIRHVNEQAQMILQMPEMVEGEQIDKFLDRDDLKVLYSILKDGSGLRSEHLTVDKRYVLAMANDVRGRGNRLYGRMISLRDETSLRDLEENARRAEHLASLGEMAAGIAHEFRNPLTSLRGCAQEIHSMSSEETEQDTRSLTKIIISETDRLTHIVEDILGFARQHSLYLQPINMNEFLEEMQGAYQGHLSLPENILLQIHVDDACPNVYTDAERLRQVMHNLIDNAIHALADKDGGMIAVNVKLITENILDSSHQAVAIEVKDNGVGIEKDKLVQVFTPFYSTRAQGTGIGLPLVQRLIRALGGIVKLDSELGQGTVVTVYLPIEEKPEV